MKLAARGVTVISTSGDLGASDGQSCHSTLTADYPSSSPYTTSLGASQLVRQSMGGRPVDVAACSVPAGSGFTTGGMFSALLPRPQWQDNVVQEYLSGLDGTLPPDSWFNRSGRAYNDVATLGSNIQIILGGQLHITGGTSASGPIFAALVGLLNDELIAHGKPPVGFFNPWLYNAAHSIQGAYRGITEGNNRCTEPGIAGPNGNGTCCDAGFEAGYGRWNPLGGLGAPIWNVLRDALLS